MTKFLLSNAPLQRDSTMVHLERCP